MRGHCGRPCIFVVRPRSHENDCSSYSFKHLQEIREARGSELWQHIALAAIVVKSPVALPKYVDLFRSPVVLSFGSLTFLTLQAQTEKLPTAAAKYHIGDRATVCGEIDSAGYAMGSRGEPTFLNLDEL
jgi:hypothetical protein